MPRTADVAIIGGGAIGCSIAYYLAKRGIRCAVFEQRRFASGASGATAGVVGPLWHLPTGSKETLDLGLLSLEMFPALAAELLDAGVDPEFQQKGVMKVAITGEEAEILKRDLVWQAELGLGAHWLERDEVLEREPEINPDVLGGVFSPKEGHVRGEVFVNALVHAASRMGAAFYEGVEAFGLVTEGQRVRGVRTSLDVFHAGHTVIAAGPWTGIAGRWIPYSLPVRPVKGQRILLRKPGFLPKCPVHAFRGYVLPQADGNVLVAATRHEMEFDQEITADGLGQMLAAAAYTFPTLRDARFVEARAGVRPGSPDDIPILGPVPGWDGLSIASGHDATGIMLSPGTGALMADYIASGDARPLKAFSLERFGLRP